MSPSAAKKQKVGKYSVAAIVIILALVFGAYRLTAAKNSRESNIAGAIFQNITNHAPQLTGSVLYSSSVSETNGNKGLSSIFSIENISYYYHDVSMKYAVGEKSGVNLAEALYQEFAKSPYWEVDTRYSDTITSSVRKHYSFIAEPVDKRCGSNKCFLTVSVDQFDSTADMKGKIFSFDSLYKPLTNHFAENSLPVYGYTLSLEYHPKNP